MQCTTSLRMANRLREKELRRRRRTPTTLTNGSIASRGQDLPMQSGETSTGQKFQRLVDIMARLRSPDGCPWDREQNFDTIKPYLLEETYEVMDAIDARDWEGLAEELGDLLLQP